MPSGISVFMGTIHLPLLELSIYELCILAVNVCTYLPPNQMHKVCSGCQWIFCLGQVLVYLAPTSWEEGCSVSSYVTVENFMNGRGSLKQWVLSGYLCSFDLLSEVHELDGSYGQNLWHQCRPVESESGLFKKIPPGDSYVYLSLGSNPQIISNSKTFAFRINEKALHRGLAIQWFPLLAHTGSLTLDSACRKENCWMQMFTSW